MSFILSDILKQNVAVIVQRFPDFARLAQLDSDNGISAALASIPDTFRLEPSSSGLPTLSVNGQYLHSRYNPLRDAERALDDTRIFSPDGCVFLGMGLAYQSEVYGSRWPNATLVVIEPDIRIFLLCLSSRSLISFLTHEKLALLVGTTPAEAFSVLEKLEFSSLPCYEPPALASPNAAWFAEFTEIRKRNREKAKINANTLKRFGGLWLSNMSKNLRELRERGGVDCFAGSCSGLPVLLLAAGPSLDRILPHLGELAKRCVLIVVDTALRACLRAGVHPDFIILVDPQYWNWRHLDGLSCPSSILITESAAWPAVFRFECREIFLCSSLFPLGKFLESRTAVRGELGAGGSVATTAWDFARFLGSTEIYVAGLDLGFPDKRTHFSGSIFEERTHETSNRLSTAETAGYQALYGAGPYPVPDYRGGSILTDKRLYLYAWWFESRLASYSEHKTWTLTPEGTRIPGILPVETDAVRNLPIIRPRINEILSSCMAKNATPDGEAFDRALVELKEALEDFSRLAKRGMAVCSKLLRARQSGKAVDAAFLRELDQIDRSLLDHQAKEIAAMVFLRDEETESTISPIEASLKLYTGILEAATRNLDALNHFL